MRKHVCAVQIRRAFRNLITKEHPDKGGDPERFKQIKLAYDVLSNKAKVRDIQKGAVTTEIAVVKGWWALQREHYDATGKVTKSAGEDFMDSFRGGKPVKPFVSSIQCVCYNCAPSPVACIPLALLQAALAFRPQSRCRKKNVADQITVIQKNEQSHSAGFEVLQIARISAY